MDMSLKIDNFKDDYFFLSNFYHFNFFYKDKYYISSEVAYQCEKFQDVEFSKAHSDLAADKYYGEEFFSSMSNNEIIGNFLRSLKSSGRVKRAAKILSKFEYTKKDFHHHKLYVMYDIVDKKFRNNEYLKNRLIETGTAELIEKNYWHDTYWGICNNVGENFLGKILMLVREEIKPVKDHNNIMRIL